VNEDDRIYIESIKNIQPGVELSYDYAYGYDERLTRELKEFYVCYCGTDKCRGTILKKSRKRSKGRK
jgi:SET domain-containing protein